MLLCDFRILANDISIDMVQGGKVLIWLLLQGATRRGGGACDLVRVHPEGAFRWRACGLTVLQLLLAARQHAAGEHARRGESLQRQHALTLLSGVQRHVARSLKRLQRSPNQQKKKKHLDCFGIRYADTRASIKTVPTRS